MRRKVHNHEIKGLRICLPLNDDKVLGGGIFLPGSAWPEKGCSALCHRRASQYCEQLFIEVFDFNLFRFLEAAAKLDWHLAASPDQLSVIQKPHTRQTQNQQS